MCGAESGCARAGPGPAARLTRAEAGPRQTLRAVGRTGGGGHGSAAQGQEAVSGRDKGPTASNARASPRIRTTAWARPHLLCCALQVCFAELLVHGRLVSHAAELLPTPLRNDAFNSHCRPGARMRESDNAWGRYKMRARCALALSRSSAAERQQN